MPWTLRFLLTSYGPGPHLTQWVSGGSTVLPCTQKDAALLLPPTHLSSLFTP